MTYETIARKLEDARAHAIEMGPEWVAGKGLEPLFVRLDMALGGYSGGWQDAGGSVEQLGAREMGEGYAVEIDHLLFAAGLID